MSVHHRVGFTLHTPTTPDLRITAVSDVNPADLDNLLASLVQAQKPAKTQIPATN